MKDPSRRRLLLALALAAWLVAWPPGTRALSLRHSAAELTLDVQAGRKRLLSAGSGPPTVANTGDEPARVELRIVSPSPGSLKDGYEPAPPSWFRLKDGRALAPPGKTVSVTASVQLPDDPRLQGGRYQADWLTQAVSPGGLRLELRSKLLVRVASKEDHAIEQARRNAKKREGAEFALSAKEARIDDDELGMESIRKVKLINMGSQPEVFAVAARDGPGDDGDKLDESYEPAPNPGWIRVAPVIEAGADTVIELPIAVLIPDEPRYHGRRWVFTIAVEALGSEVPKTRFFRLYVATQGAKSTRKGE